MVLDENLKVKNTNRAFLNLYGYCHNLCRNLTIHDLITDEYECQSLLNMLQDSNSGAKKTTVKLSNGESMVLWTTIKAIKGSDNEIVSYILLQTDIKEMIDLQKKTEYIAKHDPLTKLYNRLGYQDEFEKCLNDNKLFAVVFIDLDLFKQVNDSYGHDVGDVLLVYVGKRLLNALRENDVVARFGGDEFVLILNDLKAPSDVLPAVERILQSFKNDFVIHQYRMQITPSIGVSLYPKDGKSFEELSKVADTAMYEAKENGGNCYCIANATKH